jgi:hypothetical protein
MPDNIRANMHAQSSAELSTVNIYLGMHARNMIRRLLLFPPSFFMNSRFPNFVIQNNVGSAAGTGELDPALICDLSNANNVSLAACRARNDAAVRTHVDSSMPRAAIVRADALD